MKRIGAILVFCFVAFVLVAQPPQSFKYQAVVRNSSGELISNQAIGVRISIHDVSAGGTILYQETHTTSTNEFGLANFEIGKGTPTLGTFTDIGWGNNNKFLEIEIDSQGGINYISMGTSELVSVPYALFSESSADGYWEKSNEDIYYNDGNIGIGTPNPIYPLEINGTTLIGTDSKGIRLRTNGAIADIESLGTDLAINYQGYGNTVMNVVSGNVGIGTLTPAYPLHLVNSSGINWIAGFHNTSTSASSNGLVVRADGGIPLQVQNSTNSLLTIKNNGYVGIGTINPLYRFQVKESTDATFLVSIHNTSINGSGHGLAVRADGGDPFVVFSDGIRRLTVKNDGSVVIGTNTVPSNSRLQIEGSGAYDAMLRLNNIGTNGASFFMGSTNSAWGGGTNENLFVMGHGAPASANIDITIDESGRLGIGTTEPSQKLDVVGTGRFRNTTTGTVQNAVYQTYDGTLITGSSDIRLKENIEPLKGSLEKINQLQGVSFNWKAEPSMGRSIGFIAQEFEKIVPELVFTNQTDGYKGINYAEVSALLVEAMKEQQKTIEELKSRIEALENSKSKNQ